jgi:hypothetical protein
MYTKILAQMDEHEGGIAQFSRGYERFGFTREDDAIVYVPLCVCVCVSCAIARDSPFHSQ